MYFFSSDRVCSRLVRRFSADTNVILKTEFLLAGGHVDTAVAMANAKGLRLTREMLEPLTKLQHSDLVDDPPEVKMNLGKYKMELPPIKLCDMTQPAAFVKVNGWPEDRAQFLIDLFMEKK